MATPACLQLMRHLANTPTTAPDASTPGDVVTGGYTGNSFAVKAIIIFFSGLTIYNAIELVILIFFTFSRFSGLYFYSLLVSGVCVIPYSTGFLLKFLIATSSNARWLAVTLVTVGWYGMVTGQSVVLWSRLHLLVEPGDKGQWTLRWTKWMIIIDAIILHIPTTVLTFGSNGDISTETFARGYNVMEKIQMCGFFLQEVILSTLYIIQAARLLRNSMRDDAKKFFVQLLGINVIIIVMDVGLLATEAASLYLYETIIKGTIYSIKLKLEFAILGKLIHFVGRPGSVTANNERWRQASVAFTGSQNDDGSSETKGSGNKRARSAALSPGGSGDLAEFVDLSKIRTDVSHATHGSRGSQNSTDRVENEIGGRQRRRRNVVQTGRGVTEDDVDMAWFEHVDGARLPQEGKDEDGMDVLPGRNVEQV